MQSGYTNAPLHSLYKYSKWHPVFVLANNAVRKQKVAQRFYILFALLTVQCPPTHSLAHLSPKDVQSIKVRYGKLNTGHVSPIVYSVHLRIVVRVGTMYSNDVDST